MAVHGIWLRCILICALAAVGCSCGSGESLWESEKLYFDIGAPAFMDDGTMLVVHGPALKAFSADKDLKWECALRPAKWDETPVVAGDRIYLFTGDGAAEGNLKSTSFQLSAVSTAGKLLWTLPLPAEPLPLVVDAAGKVYVACGKRVYDQQSGQIVIDQGWVLRVDPSGSIDWTFDDMYQAWDRPVLAENGRLLATDGGTLYVLETDSGSLAWKFELPGAEDKHLDQAAIACAEDYYFGAYTKLYALDESGNLRWDADLYGHPVRLISADERVYCLSAASGVKAFDTAGELQWDVPAAGSGASLLVRLPDGKLCADYCTYGSHPSRGFIRCVSPDGAQLWTVERFPGGSESVSPSGMVYTSSSVLINDYKTEPRLFSISPDGSLSEVMRPSESFIYTYFNGVSMG